MGSLLLTASQLDILQTPLERKIFLEGPAGSGKTTVGIQRCMALLEAGIPASSILLLVPQRTLAEPYQEALRAPGMAPGRRIEGVTIGGLAKRMIELFWPLIAEEAGFASPNRPPSFLTLETSLYYTRPHSRPGCGFIP